MTPLPLVLSLVIGAGRPAAADSPPAVDSPAAAAATPTWNPTPEQEAVYRALRVRHDPPGCDELDALSDDPVGTYGYLVDHAEQPAWVAMRAARCLMVNHPEAAAPRLRQWVTDPNLRGLGILALTNLDRIPLELATELAALSLTEGPDPEGARRRLLRLETPELRALAELPVGGTAGSDDAVSPQAEE